MSRGSVAAVAVADYHSTVRLIDVASRQPIGDPFVGAGTSPPAQSFRPDGRVLAVSGPDGAALGTLDFDAWRADACRLAGRILTPAESASTRVPTGRASTPAPATRTRTEYRLGSRTIPAPRRITTAVGCLRPNRT